jgi:hypothetical protein
MTSTTLRAGAACAITALCAIVGLGAAAPAAAMTDSPRAAAARTAGPALAQNDRRLRDARRRRSALCARGDVDRCRAQRAAERRLKRQTRRLLRQLSRGRRLHVSPRGDDDAAGTRAKPLRTLTAALRRAEGGETIRLAAGRYPRADDTRARRTTVTVLGPAIGTARVAGMNVTGGRRVTVRGVHFTNTVVARGRARSIAFQRSDFTAPRGAGCLTARDGVRRFTVADSHIHDCTSGFGAGAGGTIPQSHGLTLEGNRFEDFTVDAIQFGQWNDVRIVGNVIDHIHDPRGVEHNDGIQLTGNVRRALIADNRISNARTQLIFLQNAVGPIDDVTVRNNLAHNAGAVAIHSQGVTRARFVNNTIWQAKDGGLWLTRGYSREPGPSVVPSDSVVVNNVAPTYRRMGGATTRTSTGNVVACLSGQREHENPGAGYACVRDIGFVDAQRGDYRLRPDAPARLRGSGALLPREDIDGLFRRAPVPGAFG